MNWKWNFDNEDDHESHSVGFHGTKARRKLSEKAKADNISDYDVYYDNEFVCRIMSDPTALIDKVNGILSK